MSPHIADPYFAGTFSLAEADERIRLMHRETAGPDATTTIQRNPAQQGAREVRLDNGRIRMLPPEGYGDVWNGGAR